LTQPINYKKNSQKIRKYHWLQVLIFFAFKDMKVFILFFKNVKRPKLTLNNLIIKKKMPKNTQIFLVVSFDFFFLAFKV
jgi:hypothetical protein